MWLDHDTTWYEGRSLSTDIVLDGDPSAPSLFALARLPIAATAELLLKIEI